MSKRIVAVSIMVLMFSIVLSGCFQSPGDDVVAVINGTEVSRSEFDKYLDLSIILYTGETEFSEAQQRQYLGHYIDETLFHEEALNRGITATESEIEEEYQSSRQFLIDEYFEGNEEEFSQRLVSLDLVDDDLRELVERNLIIRKFIQHLEDTMDPVTDEDIEDFYNENLEEYFSFEEQREIRHILVESEDLAESIIVRLERGEDFAELAKEYSMDINSAKNGGMMAFAEDGTFVEPFNEVAFSLPVGEVSDVVETEFGFHVLEVLQIMEPDVVELDDELREYIGFLLEQERSNNLIHEILEELKKDNVEKKI